MDGRARPAWMASLIIHGVLVGAVAWWLTERFAPTTRPDAAPVPLNLAMFQAPASVEALAEPAPLQETPPPQVVPEPVPLPAEERLASKPVPKPVPVKPKPFPSSPPRFPTQTVEPLPAPTVESLPVPATGTPATAPSPAPMPVAPSLAEPPVMPAPDPALEEGYRARIRQAVDEHKHYPRMARRLGLEGRVVVAFTVEADGRLAGVRLVESSGSEILDEAALEAVREAAPFPPFPAGLGRQQWGFTLPLMFALER